MSKVLCSCVQCRAVIAADQLKNHFNSARCRKKYIIVPPHLQCLFCERTLLSENAYRQHSIRCKLNPNAIQLPTAPRRKNPNRVANNQYTKAKALNQPVPQVSDQTRAKISAHTTQRNKKYWTQENRNKHSRAMQAAVIAAPNSYRGSHTAGRVKRYWVNGMHVIGTWEKLLLNFALDRVLLSNSQLIVLYIHTTIDSIVISLIFISLTSICMSRSKGLRRNVINVSGSSFLIDCLYCANQIFLRSKISEPAPTWRETGAHTRLELPPD